MKIFWNIIQRSEVWNYLADGPDFTAIHTVLCDVHSLADRVGTGIGSVHFRFTITYTTSFKVLG